MDIDVMAQCHHWNNADGKEIPFIPTPKGC